MHRGFQQSLTNTVYVKVRSNRFELRQIASGKTVSVVPTQSFTTNHLLIGQFTEAEETLRNGLRRLNEGNWSLFKPRLVIHPMEKTAGGLSQVEARILKEPGAGVGARKAVVWIGNELSDQQVLALL